MTMSRNFPKWQESLVKLSDDGTVNFHVQPTDGFDFEIKVDNIEYYVKVRECKITGKYRK